MFTVVTFKSNTIQSNNSSVYIRNDGVEGQEIVNCPFYFVISWTITQHTPSSGIFLPSEASSYFEIDEDDSEPFIDVVIIHTSPVTGGRLI